MLPFLFALVASAAAQEYIIHDVAIGNGNGDDFDGTVKQGGLLDVGMNASFTPPGGYKSHPGTCELISLATDQTMDIIGAHQGRDELKGIAHIFSCYYWVSEAMPLGLYYVKSYIDGEASVGMSKPFRIVKSDSPSVNCTPMPPFQPISSTADTNYTSLRIFDLHRYAYPDWRVYINWFYIDYRNYDNVGISNLSIIGINQDNGQTVDFGQVPLDQGLSMFPEDHNMTTGRWRFRATYNNKYERNGTSVSTLSDILYVMDGDCSSNPLSAALKIDVGLRISVSKV